MKEQDTIFKGMEDIFKDELVLLVEKDVTHQLSAIVKNQRCLFETSAQ
jgi:hypothetical protein